MNEDRYQGSYEIDLFMSVASFGLSVTTTVLALTN